MRMWKAYVRRATENILNYYHYLLQNIVKFYFEFQNLNAKNEEIKLLHNANDFCSNDVFTPFFFEKRSFFWGET